MVTLHEVITFLVSMQISISSLQTHTVNRCGRSRHVARKLSLRRKRSSPNVFEMAATETITSIIFFFSSRRRHTRCGRDWSSDVCSSDLDLLGDLDLVADLDVVVALHANAALHAGTHFGHVVLEAAQRFQLALEDHHVLAQRSEERRVGKECRSRWSQEH